MIQCKDGHFYDPAKHSACPWCAQPFDVGGEGKTTPVRPSFDDQPKPTPIRAANALSEDTNIGSEDAKTQPLYAARPPAPAPVPVAAPPPPPPQPAGPPEPVVGWLVAIAGPERGRDFRLHAERNFVGRGTEMDVAISGDARVSRARHAIVTFEPRKKIFYLSPGDASGLVYLNDDLLDKTVPIGPDDRIEVGDTTLKLVPFVTGDFSWS
ncbi:MAG: FHA domain-containing protein [Acidobacteriota bacterium]